MDVSEDCGWDSGCLAVPYYVIINKDQHIERRKMSLRLCILNLTFLYVIKQKYPASKIDKISGTQEWTPHGEYYGVSTYSW